MKTQKEKYWGETPGLNAIHTAKLCGCTCMVTVKSVERVNECYWHIKLKHKQNCRMNIDNFFNPKGTTK